MNVKEERRAKTWFLLFDDESMLDVVNYCQTFPIALINSINDPKSNLVPLT